MAQTTGRHSGMYLKNARLACFALTQALCITVVGLSAKGLRDGIDKKALAKSLLPGASLDITDILGVGGAVTAASGIASILCLIMSLLLLLDPHRPETLRTIRMKEGAFAFSAIFWLATLIPSTVIMATRSGVVHAPGIPDSLIAGLVKASGQNLAYSKQVWVKAYVAVGWVAFVSTLVNLVLVSLAARHMHKNQNLPTENPAASTMAERGHASMEKSALNHHDEGSARSETPEQAASVA